MGGGYATTDATSGNYYVTVTGGTSSDIWVDTTGATSTGGTITFNTGNFYSPYIPSTVTSADTGYTAKPKPKLTRAEKKLKKLRDKVKNFSLFD